MVSTSFYLAGSLISFLPETSGISITLAPRYIGSTDLDKVDVHVRVHLEEYQGQPLGSPSYIASNWAAYPTGNGIVIEFGKKNMPPGKYAYTVIFNHDGMSGDLFLNQRAITEDYSPIELPPSMLDEVFASQILAYRKGLIFHACALKENQQTGYIFAGVSGSGKTTTAKLWQKYSNSDLLGDERVAVIKQHDTYRVYSTPWHSPDLEIAQGSAPLKRGFILQHDSSNRTRELGPAEAVSLLLSRSYLPVWDAAGMSFTLEFLDELCHSIPFYELGFTPDKRAVEYIQCLKDR